MKIFPTPIHTSLRYWTHYGSNSNNNMTGSDFQDVFYTYNGRDRVYAGGGNDIIFGGSGRDIFYGDDGNDTLYGYGGVDFLHGGRGEDHIYGGDSRDWLWGDEGNDWLYGEEGRDTLYGGDGIDHLYGGAGNDTLTGGRGADVLDGGDGIDTANYSTSIANVRVDLAAGTGRGQDAHGDTLINIENVTGSNSRDVLKGDGQDNVLSGLGSRDNIYGGDGDDTILGGAGDDELFGERGADFIDGGAGDEDIAKYIKSSAGVEVNLTTGEGRGGDAQGDRLVNVEQLMGSQFDDTFIGDSADNFLTGLGGDDVLRGGSGDDLLRGGVGNDIMDGGAGNDTASLRFSGSFGMRIDLEEGETRSIDTGDMVDELISIENIEGTGWADRIYGDDGDNQLNGMGGDDRIEGGDGNDTLIGGSGTDRFIFDDYWGNDVIKDFDLNGEKLNFDNVRRLGDDDMTMVQQGNDTIITFDEDNAGTIVLENVEMSLLTDDHFSF